MAEGKEAREPDTGKKQHFKAKVSWRELSITYVDSVARIADKIHPDLPESDGVYAERSTLFPEGCLGLFTLTLKSNELCGYAISHPIRHRQPPVLNTSLGTIASDAEQYYIHDLAILPEFRGGGLAQECIQKLLTIAKRYPTTCLISVYGTTQFWSRFGFACVEIDEALKKKVLEYGADATYLERKNE